MALISARFGVSVLFFFNGFVIGNWAPQIPEFAGRLSLDESQMGLMIAVFGLGSLVAMPLAGIGIAKSGFSPALKITSMVAPTTLLWLTLSPNTIVAALALFAFGAFIAAMDVAMNAMAVDAERKISLPIMSSCHGFWSLGGLAGAVGGGYLIQTFGSMGQAIFALMTGALAVGLAWNKIADSKAVTSQQQSAIVLPTTLLPYLIGIIALFSAMPEGAIIDWSAYYLRNEIGSNAFVSSLGFGAFSAAMAIVRFLGDPVRKRLGAVVTVKICSLIAAFGFLLSGLANTPQLIIAGFAITGLGLSNLIPIAFSAAGNLPGISAGISLSLTTTIGYSGVLVAPALLGYVAEFTGFAILFSSLSFFLIVVFFLASLTKHADFEQR